jgi:quercetin 2,3-dioxygenase
MNTPKPMFVREVARIDDPRFVSGQVAGHRARRLIDASDAAFADPFVLMAEEKMTRVVKTWGTLDWPAVNLAA